METRAMLGGRYRVIHRLGAGGMATVYLRARPASAADRHERLRADAGANPVTAFRAQLIREAPVPFKLPDAA